MAGSDQARILAAQAHGSPARLLDQRDEPLVDAAAQDHFDDVHGGTVCDAQPVFKRGLNAQLLQPVVDLGAAAVDQHGPDADAGQQDEVGDDARFEGGVDHRSTTVFHHHRFAVEALQVGQGFGQDGDAVQGGVGLGCVGGMGVREGTRKGGVGTSDCASLSSCTRSRSRLPATSTK